ncbi:ATPase [Xanthocytophaga agilis]|uniref:ATPase n=1 Tax=Xanthocytophaga agilis TaxID=3048010 RepID=A0AAE3R852_9BACT|nr:ATPase [Xanthocytophaga agilis]MDJ1502523.1 ATPase [Xanthocytophaga agilis]
MPFTSLTFLCVSSYFKGAKFLSACKEAGCTIYLLTSKAMADKPWPHDAIDEVFYMEETEWDMSSIVSNVAHLMRQQRIDRIVAMDDIDLEKAAILRENFRIPGIGQTTARYFRDRLAMRMKAAEAGINVPSFCALFTDKVVHHYTQTVSPPWILKPRTESSAGTKKIHSIDELWNILNGLEDMRHNYILEQFKPGDTYYVDTLVMGGKIVFDWYNRNLSNPVEDAYKGTLFRSVTVPFQSKAEKSLKRLNNQIIKAFGIRNSAIHSEIVQAKEDEQFYFVETSARVGGAYIAEMIEAASGINLWQEWANIEIASARSFDYKLPEVKNMYSGLLLSLSHNEHLDTTSFADSEIIWKINDPHHIGFVLQSPVRDRILELLESYTDRIFRDYHHTAPV